MNILTLQRIKDIKEISIAVDTWDDIFSDFDPAPLSERTLSEDFIIELKKRYRESERSKPFIDIWAPVRLKDESSEKIVVQRLKRHFKRQFLQKQKEINATRARGVLFVIMGIVFLGAITFLTYFKVVSELTNRLLDIVFMPLGWFGIWEGFSKIVDTSPGAVSETLLFQKLSNADYRFKFIEEKPDASAKLAS